MQRATWMLLTLLILLVGCRATQVKALLPSPTVSTITLTPMHALEKAEPTTPARATVPPFPSPTATVTPGPPRITLIFTGNIVPARCVQAAVEAHGDNPDYLYREVAPILRQADMAIGGALAAALSDYPPMTGCKNTFVLVGRTYHAAALARAGIALINIATNHIKNCGLPDCGDRAFLDTLRALKAAGIRVVGGGRNLDEALEPAVVDLQGVRFGFAGWSALERRYYAGPNTPGTAPLTREAVTESFRRAREQGAQVLIALPHWGPEYDFTPSHLQRQTARMLVDLGADVVVGNHPHVVQGIERIGDVPVFYSLGSFLFDQTWGIHTRESVLLRMTFEGPRLVSWSLIPLVYDEEGVIHLAQGERAEEILGHIQANTPFLLPTPNP